MKKALIVLIGGAFAANAYAQSYGAAPDAPPPHTKAAYQLAAEQNGGQTAAPAVTLSLEQTKNAQIEKDYGLQPSPGR